MRAFLPEVFIFMHFFENVFTFQMLLFLCFPAQGSVRSCQVYRDGCVPSGADHKMAFPPEKTLNTRFNLSPRLFHKTPNTSTISETLGVGNTLKNPRSVG